MINNTAYPHSKANPSPECQIREGSEHEQNSADLNPHNDVKELGKSDGYEIPIYPHNLFCQSTEGYHHVLSAPSNQFSDRNSGFGPQNVQLPFTPECALEVEVFQQWRSGQPAYQPPSAPSEIPDVVAWMSNTNAAHEQISMTDSGVDFSMPPQDRNPNDECPSSFATQEICANPDKCELSLDMVETMQRFSVPHICEYEQAKRQLVDKIVNKVLQNAAPRIIALLEEELQKREGEEREMEEDDDEDIDLDGKAKL